LNAPDVTAWLIETNWRRRWPGGLVACPQRLRPVNPPVILRQAFSFYLVAIWSIPARLGMHYAIKLVSEFFGRKSVLINP
jgi:hypothetical protein